MSVLGIDVGTSTCKGLVLTADGRILAQRQCDYAAKPTVTQETAELAAEVFRDGVFSLIRDLADKTKDVDPIRAIALSTHGETLIPVDADGNALRPALLSMDRRCAAEAKLLAEQIGTENFYRICGTPIHTQYPVPKIMWLMKYEPETVKRTARYCTAQDYLHGALGVGGFVDHSLASRFGGFDIRRHDWSDEIFAAAGLDKSLFSKPMAAGNAVGEIPREIARELHLEEGVKLVLGGHDQPCAALAMGAKEDAVTVSAGSYECATVMTDAPLNDENGYRFGLNSYCHVLDRKYVTLAFFTSGLMVNWFTDKFCSLWGEDQKSVLAKLESVAPNAPTGICFTPHVYGSMNPCWDDNARARILGLTASAGIPELYRALLEGAACELEINLSVLEGLSGKKREITFCGGGASSELWMQIRADLLDRPISRLNDRVDASCMGAAILAGVGSGTFASAEDAVRAIRYSRTVFVPRNASAYEEQKREYRALYKGKI